VNDVTLGVLGLGTVGAGVVRILQTHGAEMQERVGARLVLRAIADTDLTRPREGLDLARLPLSADAGRVLDDPAIQIVIELVGGLEPARSFILRALAAGKHVVTANKALLAHHGPELFAEARRRGVLLGFEAAVAGGIPLIRAVKDGLAANRIRSVSGIVNGTCNYILTKMEKEGLSFEACLREAQRLGYAEADPAFDIEGNDTAHKLAILTSLAYGTAIAANDIYLEGITNISIDDIHAAADLGYRIKLLGVAQRTESGIEQRVHPTMVPLDSVIAQVDGVTNAVAIESDILGELLMVGPGAGGNATASAVLGDIADIAKSRPGAQHVPAFGRPVTALLTYKRAQIQSHEGGYFIRLKVVDRTGVFAKIATHMAENHISLESIVQHSKHPVETGEPQTIILVTHATTEQSVRKAVASIKSEGYLVGDPQVIRIERPKAA